jgi:hypothetical protein
MGGIVMSWINNCKDKKPDIDKKYKDLELSDEVLIHLKNGLTFLGYYDYNNECWYSETIEIHDSDVMFWCKIPKLPKIIEKK